jgi:H+/Cl- antiporter ClcA
MTVNDWAALILAVISILGSFVVAVRWLVKHFLNELKPNGGSSIKDAVNRLERQVEEIYSILINNNKS